MDVSEAPPHNRRTISLEIDRLHVLQILKNMQYGASQIGTQYIA